MSASTHAMSHHCKQLPPLIHICIDSDTKQTPNTKLNTLPTPKTNPLPILKTNIKGKTLPLLKKIPFIPGKAHSHCKDLYFSISKIKCLITIIICQAFFSVATCSIIPVIFFTMSEATQKDPSATCLEPSNIFRNPLQLLPTWCCHALS